MLDLPSIVDVAVAIARSEGLAALTMRRVADELGRSPMSLYRHVADRQGLLLAMLDRVAARIVIPAPRDDPRADIAALMRAVHTAASDEPWLVPALVQEELAGPRILPLLERLFAALARAGIVGAPALSANGLLWEFTLGELFTVHYERADAWNRRMVHASDPVSFPALHSAMRDGARAASGAEARDGFDAHLQIVLEGLLGPAARHDVPGRLR